MSKDKTNNRLLLDSIFNGIAYSLTTATEKDIQEEAEEVFGSVEAGHNGFDEILYRIEWEMRNTHKCGIRPALDKT